MIYVFLFLPKNLKIIAPQSTELNCVAFFVKNLCKSTTRDKVRLCLTIGWIKACFRTLAFVKTDSFIFRSFRQSLVILRNKTKKCQNKSVTISNSGAPYTIARHDKKKWKIQKDNDTKDKAKQISFVKMLKKPLCLVVFSIEDKQRKKKKNRK